MFVYFTQGHHVKRIPNVTLKDCVSPTVNGISEDSLDPALWFKVMICDSILVDLDRRHVFWNCNLDPGSGDLHKCHENSMKAETVRSFFRNKELLLEDEVACTFDPFFCELFDIAAHIFQQIGLQIFNEDGNVRTYQTVMLLLHSFLLPMLRLKLKHHNKVREVLATIESKETLLSKQIEKKNDSTANGIKSLRKMRQDFLSNNSFTKASYFAGVDERFIEILSKGIALDIADVKNELQQTERELVGLSKSNDKTTVSRIKELKAKREDNCKLMEKLIKSEKAMKSSKRSSRMSNYFSWSSNQVNLHSIYMEIANHIDTLANETAQLMNTKLKVSEVRESVSFTLGELEKYGESLGFSRQRGSLYIDTDQEDLNRRPEVFLTTRDKIQLIMNGEKKEHFTGEMVKFISRIKNKCKRLCDESGVFTDFLSCSLTSDGDYEVVQTPTVLKKEELAGAGGVLQHECKHVCKDIIEHISFTASQLEANIHPDNYFCKSNLSVIVYMLYEEYVLRDVMPALCSIYEITRKEPCSRLAVWLAGVTLESLELNVYQVMKSPTHSQSKSHRMMTLERVARQSLLSRNSLQAPNSEPDPASTDVRNLYRELSREIPDSFIGALEIDIPDEDILANNHDGTELDELPRTGLDLQCNDASEVSPDIKRGTCFKERSSVVPSADRDSSRNPTSRLIGQKHNIKSFQSKLESPRGPRCKNPIMKPDVKDAEAQRFYDCFVNFDTFISAVIQNQTLNGKLREFTKSIKYIEKQLSVLRSVELEKSEICLDDLLDVAVILLTAIDRQRMVVFYSHLTMLIDMIPPFIQNTIHEYALVIYQSAFQFLFDRSVSMGSRKEYVQ